MDEAANWQQRIDSLWMTFDHQPSPDFLAAMKTLVAERPPNDALALFEYGSALDSTGYPQAAVENYRRALALDLPSQRRRRATIQMASSLRNLGHAEEGVLLLSGELDRMSDDLDDAVRAFLSLCLTSIGREREAVSVALTALAPHLSRYNRSLAAYASKLV